MSLTIVDRQKRIRLDRPAIRRLVALALGEHGRSEADMTVVVAGDAFLRELNLTYRGVDAPTDVLSFWAPQELESGAPRDAADEPEPVLGDVVISADRAVAQAKARGVTARRELLKLVAHGTLHLLGHDHEATGERRKMSVLESRYVRAAEAGGKAR